MLYINRLFLVICSLIALSSCSPYPMSSDEFSEALPFLIVFFIIIAIPAAIYILFGFETKKEGNTVSFRKKMWAVWAGMAAYFCLCLWIFCWTYILLFIVKDDADKFPSWLRYALSAGGIIGGVTFFYRAIQVYRNRFDKITVFEDRIEIVNNGHVPAHTTIFFRDIKELNVTEDSFADDDSSSYLKINDYVLDLRDVNLRKKSDEIGQILTANLKAFRAKNSEPGETSNQ
ncbi:MAG: hypothetical protein RL432_2265 [Bacteroidota bacterium]